MLKKWISILFLSTYLLTATELNELFKLPLLVEHFVQHNEGNKHVNFWEFLCDHYSTDSIKDADYDEDMKLPFKSQSHFEKNNNINSFCFELAIQINNLPSFIVKDFVILSEQLNNNSSINTIWQPPKFS
jgi:hypothetical protein